MVKFVSEVYTLQYDTTCDRKLISAGELVVKMQYLICTYWISRIGLLPWVIKPSTCGEDSIRYQSDFFLK